MSLMRPTPLRLLQFATLVVVVALVGSLYLGTQFEPCVLCWYQRITLFPQVVILGVALWRKDTSVQLAAILLLAVGWLISLYHNVLYYNRNFFGDSSFFMPCSTTGASCTERYLELAGFLTIPLMSFLAHSLALAALIWMARLVRAK